MLAKKILYKTLRIILGIFFLLLGIIGGFLPVIQGWIFILIAVYLFSYDIPFMRRWLHRLKERFPHHASRLRREESRMRLFWRKIARPFRRRSAAGPVPAAIPAPRNTANGSPK